MHTQIVGTCAPSTRPRPSQDPRLLAFLHGPAKSHVQACANDSRSENSQLCQGDLQGTNGACTQTHRKPIFIGFGSMVPNEEELEACLVPLLEGAALTGNRILVQTGWSDVTQDTFDDIAVRAERAAALVRGAMQSVDSPIESPADRFTDSLNNSSSDISSNGHSTLWTAAQDCFLLRTPCEHSWLFRQVGELVIFRLMYSEWFMRNVQCSSIAICIPYSQ